MLALEWLAERRILEAIEQGELSGLPGEGQPLDLGDDALVPEELRLANRILRNAGCVPPEVETLRHIADIERCVQALEEGESRSSALRKLQLLRARLEQSGAGRLTAGAYLGPVLDRLSGADPES